MDFIIIKARGTTYNMSIKERIYLQKTYQLDIVNLLDTNTLITDVPNAMEKITLYQMLIWNKENMIMMKDGGEKEIKRTRTKANTNKENKVADKIKMKV